MSLTFASNLTKMIDAGLGGEVIAPDTSVAIGYRMQYNMVSGPVASWNDPEGGLPINIAAEFGPIQAGTGDPSPENVRPISGRTEVNVWREATYDTSAEPILTIPLGQTVYGGRLNVTSGVLTVDMAMVDMGSLTWMYREGSGLGDYFYANFSGIKYAGDFTSTTYPILTSMYKMTARSQNFVNYCMCVDGIQTQRLPSQVQVKDSRYTNAATFKTAMSGVQLCYELAQPVTVQLSPQTINSLLGQNNVWSDAGDVSVTWKEKLYTEGY